MSCTESMAIYRWRDIASIKIAVLSAVNGFMRTVLSSLGFLNLSARKPIFNTISMGKIYDRLQKQLQVEEHREDAEDCIKIYNKLKEMNDGSVWSSDWQVLTTIGGWIGERPHAQMAYKPSKVGYVFLNGIRGENTNS